MLLLELTQQQSFNPLAGKSELRPAIKAQGYDISKSFNPLAGKSELRLKITHTTAMNMVSIPLRGKVNCDLTKMANL